MKNKVAIMPCNGVGQVVATISRKSAYRIHSLRPEKTALLSSPEVATDKPECIELVKNSRVIVIEGCKERCGAFMLKEKGAKDIVEIFVPAVCADKKISIAKENRACLGKNGMKIVEEIVKTVLRIIDSAF